MDSISFAPFSVFPEYLKGGGGHHSGDNGDEGAVPSGDITLIHQRSTMLITQYPNGVPDWTFLLDSTLAQPEYTPVHEGGNVRVHAARAK